MDCEIQLNSKALEHFSREHLARTGKGPKKLASILVQLKPYEEFSRFFSTLSATGVFVERLRFNGCAAFNDPVAKLLAEWLGLCTIENCPRELDLHGCAITSVGFLRIMSAIEDCGAYPIPDVDGKSRPLCMHFANNFIEPDIIQEKIDRGILMESKFAGLLRFASAQVSCDRIDRIQFKQGQQKPIDKQQQHQKMKKKKKKNKKNLASRACASSEPPPKPNLTCREDWLDLKDSKALEDFNSEVLQNLSDIGKNNEFNNIRIYPYGISYKQFDSFFSTLYAAGVFVERLRLSGCAAFNDPVAKLLAEWLRFCTMANCPRELNISCCAITSVGFLSIMSAIEDCGAYPIPDVDGKSRPLYMNFTMNFIEPGIIQQKIDRGILMESTHGSVQQGAFASAQVSCDKFQNQLKQRQQKLFASEMPPPPKLLSHRCTQKQNQQQSAEHLASSASASSMETPPKLNRIRCEDCIDLADSSLPAKHRKVVDDRVVSVSTLHSSVLTFGEASTKQLESPDAWKTISVEEQETVSDARWVWFMVKDNNGEHLVPKHSDPVKVWLHRKPFAQGALRYSFHLIFGDPPVSKPNHHLVIKEGKYVVKRATPEKVYHIFLQNHKRAASLAAEFKSRLVSTCGVDKAQKYEHSFVNTHVIKIADPDAHSGFRYATAERFLPGTYVKYNGNDGYVNQVIADDNAMVAAGFSHFSFDYTDGEELCVDIQGVGKHWTDPQLHSRRKTYGVGDHGLDGMRRFFSSHTCSQLCYMLGLRSVAEDSLSFGPKLNPPEQESSTHDRTCVVCLSEDRAAICKPCNHFCLCSGCANDMLNGRRECPICKRPFSSIKLLTADSPHPSTFVRT